MTGSPPEISGAWIEHTGDGTLVHDTDRGDKQLRDLIKKAGFRWSRNLDAWYLPRSWHFDTRGRAVDELTAAVTAIGRNLPVQADPLRTRTSAEIEDEKVDKALARADRLTERADRLAADADQTEAAARRSLEAWPLGQPLVGSPARMRSQRNWLDRQRRRLDRAAETRAAAADARQRAQNAQATARTNENPGVIGRRLERLREDLRRVDRTLGEQGYDPTNTAGLQRLQAIAADLRERIEWNEQALARAEAAAGRLWAPGDFELGDEVRVAGFWYPIRRINKKTLTVPALVGLGSEHLSWTDTVPYTNIQARRRDGVEHTTPPPSTTP